MDTAMKWTIGLGAAAFGAGVLAALVSKPAAASATAPPAPMPAPTPAAPSPALPPAVMPISTTITDPNFLTTARNALVAVAPVVGAVYASPDPSDTVGFTKALGVFQTYVNANVSISQLATYGIPGPLRTDGVLDEATYMALIAIAAAVAASQTPAPSTPAPAPVNNVNPNLFAPV